MKESKKWKVIRNNSSMIKTENLTKCYGRIKAIDGVNLKVEPGDTYVLLGPNGAGKTTTVKILAGVLESTSGQSFIKGLEVLKHQFEIKKIIGYLPEDITLLGYLTPREFIDFIGKVRNIPDDEIEKRREEYISIFNLKNDADRLIYSLSKGNQKKVALIASILHSPELLLLDEPTDNLDPEMIVILKNCLEKFKNKGVTILISTHILSFAEKICNKVAIIKEGNILREGSLTELRNLYGTDSLEEIYMKILFPVK